MPRIARTPKQTVEYLLENAIQYEDGCLICHLAFGSNGYVILNVEGLVISAHRFIYKQCCGPIPSCMVVCHRCDRKTCINKDHLFIGTQQENLHDMIQKGRRIGFKSSLREGILQAHANGLSYVEISRKLNIPYNTVRNHVSPFGIYYKESE